MTKDELTAKTDAAITEIQNALQTMYNAMNNGQQKQIVKDDAVKALFDRYGVEYGS